MSKEIEWVATVYPDWTTLQLGPGRVFAFNRATGKVYKVPHPDCPFVEVNIGQLATQEPPQ